MTKDVAVDAAHFLIPDGGAARHGDDPSWIGKHPGLTSLYPLAVEIERAEALSWSDAEWAAIRQKLISYGPTRLPDVERLARHRGEKV